MPPPDPRDQIKYLEADIKRLLNETARLERENMDLKAKLGWHKEYTHLDGGNANTRSTLLIIKERDEAQAQTATACELARLMLRGLRSEGVFSSPNTFVDLEANLRKIVDLAEEGIDGFIHVRRLKSFLALADIIVIERAFYEEVSGKPLEWIPVKSTLIKLIEESIAEFSGIYGYDKQKPPDKRYK